MWWRERWQHVTTLERRAALPVAQLAQLIAAAAMGAGVLKKNDELTKVDSHLPGFAHDGFPSVPPMIETDLKTGLARAELPQELFDEIQFMRQDA